MLGPWLGIGDSKEKEAARSEHPVEKAVSQQTESQVRASASQVVGKDLLKEFEL